MVVLMVVLMDHMLWLCWVKVVLHTQFQLERMESSENVA